MTVVVLCDRLKRPAPRKKYGLLSNYDDSVEMEAVESDEDDTLYEARSLRRSEVNTPRADGKCSPVTLQTTCHSDTQALKQFLIYQLWSFLTPRPMLELIDPTDR